MASTLIYSTGKKDDDDEYDDLQDYSDDGDYANLQYDDEYDLRGLYDYYELVASSPGRFSLENDEDDVKNDDDYDDVQDDDDDISSIGNRIRMCLSHWWPIKLRKS